MWLYQLRSPSSLENVAGLHRLAREVVRHEDAVAVEIALVRDGEGVAAVFALGLHLLAGALDGVVLVVDGGQLEGERVLDVEAVHRVLYRLVEDLLLAVQDAQAHRRDVADDQGGLALHHLQVELVGGQGRQDVLRGGAAVRDLPLLAGEAFRVVEEGLAVAGELAVLLGGALLLAQLGLAAQEQVLPGHHRDGLPGVVGDIFLHGRLRRAGGHPLVDGILDEGVIGVASREVFSGQVLGGLVAPAAEQAPEHVFVVVGDVFQQEREVGEAVQVVVLDVEFGIVRLQQALFLLRDIAAEALGGGRRAFAVEIDRDRLAELLDVGVGLRRQFVAELPVGARTGLDVFPAGVVVIPGAAFLRGFLLDAFEDVALVLGLVRFDGLVVFSPQFLQDGIFAVPCAGGKWGYH